MKAKNLLLSISVLLFSCSDKSKPLIPTDINTVYWDFTKLPNTLNAPKPTLIGEVGNNKDVDSLHVTINDLDHNTVLYDGTIPKINLTLETRKDFSTAVTKWYLISFPSPVTVPANTNIAYTLIAHTPFESGQDLRPKITSTLLVQ